MNRHVFCIKWGTRYGPDYVNRLRAMTARHLTLQHQFVCFTDDPAGLHPEIQHLPLPELGVAHPENVPGKWRKTALWQKDLFGLTGTALFIDLDTVIVANLDDFFQHGDPDDIILTRNWLKPHKRLGQTTLFRFPIGGYPQVYEEFKKDPQGIADRYQFEQHYVTSHVADNLHFWPKEWVRHYRVHCLGNNYLMRYFRPARLPTGAKAIAFPGVPNPAEAAAGIWNGKQDHHPSPWEHFRAAFSQETRIKPTPISHLKCYQQPCPWVSEHWTEDEAPSGP
ncbi:MAG: glycosyl transferase [Verrucomicrobiota bacterium JB023]|nr:glycosyl transferase [Verrucomicrobiota bacterium JB023]